MLKSNNNYQRRNNLSPTMAKRNTAAPPPISAAAAASSATAANVNVNIANGNKVTPDREKPQKSKSPHSSTSPKNHHLTVDKQIVDELLLVCSVIGSTASSSSTTSSKKDKNPNLIPVNECLHWLQDLQRALRRDEDAYRPISLLLGQWKIVQQKLLPLVLSCRYDSKMVLTIVKILVILTKPLSESAKNAARLIIDVKSKNADEE